MISEIQNYSPDGPANNNCDHYLSIRWLCLSSDSRQTVFEYTNPHDTVVKNGVHLIIKFSCIKFQKYIFQLFLTNILDHVTQINSETIKKFYP